MPALLHDAAAHVARETRALIDSGRFGSASESLKRARIVAAIVRTSSSPKRIPIQVREPPPNGT